MILKEERLKRILRGRRRAEAVFKVLALSALGFGIVSLGALLYDVFSDGAGRVSWQFLTSFPSRHPEKAGILSALAGTGYMMALTIAIAFPVGVGAAIYLEEYARENRFTRFIEVNIANLAGVPSIIYGLLGLELFVRMMRFDRSLLAGALTMALLILPIIIIASREALKSVPGSIREAAFALGATRWQAVRTQVLPIAFPGMLTGSILAFSRAIGEAAPMVTIGALAYIAFLPESPMSFFTVLPIQIFNWVSRPQKAFLTNAAAGIVVLLVVLLAMNALAIYLRQRYQKKVNL